ncbi:unnamed protein product, partial [Polarella glacialis]
VADGGGYDYGAGAGGCGGGLAGLLPPRPQLHHLQTPSGAPGQSHPGGLAAALAALPPHALANMPPHLLASLGGGPGSGPPGGLNSLSSLLPPPAGLQPPGGMQLPPGFQLPSGFQFPPPPQGHQQQQHPGQFGGGSSMGLPPGGGIQLPPGLAGLTAPGGFTAPLPGGYSPHFGAPPGAPGGGFGAPPGAPGGGFGAPPGAPGGGGPGHFLGQAPPALGATGPAGAPGSEYAGVHAAAHAAALAAAHAAGQAASQQAGGGLGASGPQGGPPDFGAAGGPGDFAAAHAAAQAAAQHAAAQHAQHAQYALAHAAAAQHAAQAAAQDFGAGGAGVPGDLAAAYAAATAAQGLGQPDFGQLPPGPQSVDLEQLQQLQQQQMEHLQLIQQHEEQARQAQQAQHMAFQQQQQRQAEQAAQQRQAEAKREDQMRQVQNTKNAVEDKKQKLAEAQQSKCHLHKKNNNKCKFCMKFKEMVDEVEKQGSAALNNARAALGYGAAEQKPTGGDRPGLNRAISEEPDRENRSKAVELSNTKSFGFSGLLQTHVTECAHFKSLLSLETFEQLVDETYTYAKCVEPYNANSGTVPSALFCCLYRFFTLGLNARQLRRIMESQESPYIRCCGFLYVRFGLQHDAMLGWLTEYLLDDEEFFLSAEEKNQRTTVGEFVEQLLSQEKYFNAILPRLPMATKRHVEEKLAPLGQNRKRMQTNRAALDTFRERRLAVSCNINGTWVDCSMIELDEHIPSRPKVVVRMEESGSEEVVDLGKVILRGESSRGSGGRRGSDGVDWSRDKGRSDKELLDEMRAKDRDKAVCSSGKEYARKPLGYKAACALPREQGQASYKLMEEETFIPQSLA